MPARSTPFNRARPVRPIAAAVALATLLTGCGGALISAQQEKQIGAGVDEEIDCAEIAGVMGHELAHVTQRHRAQQIEKAFAAQLVSGFFPARPR